MKTSTSPVLPLVEVKKMGLKQKPRVIVLTPSFTSSEDGSALAIAQNWHRYPNTSRVAHYIVDNDRGFRCVSPNVTINRRGHLVVMLCAEPSSGSQFWDNTSHNEVLNRAAKLVSELTELYNIPVRYFDGVSPKSWLTKLLRKDRGLMVEEETGWPWKYFLKLVEVYNNV